MAYQNTSPSEISFKKTISLSTVDESNGNKPLSEGYNVTGPVCAGSPAISIAGGAKMIVPISSAGITEGAPCLKIHLPTSSGNTLYLTYCVANKFMEDGFYDYKTGVPLTYREAIKKWIKTKPDGTEYVVTTLNSFNKDLKFTAYGKGTYKPAEAVTFTIRFNASYPIDIVDIHMAPNPGGGGSLGGFGGIVPISIS